MPDGRPVIVCTELEKWIAIPGAAGYEVSSIGRVRSFWTTGRRPTITQTAHSIVPFPDGDGRLHVGLRTKHGTLRRKVHHLVLEAFVGLCPEGMECRHLDGDHTNNRVENLCWGTRQENLADRKTHGSNARCGQRGSAHRDAKLTEEQVREIKRFRKDGYSTVAIGKMFGINNSNVSRIVNGRTWKHVS